MAFELTIRFDFELFTKFNAEVLKIYGRLQRGIYGAKFYNNE